MQSPSFRRTQTLQVLRFNYEMCSVYFIVLWRYSINVLGYELYVAIQFIFWH